MSGKASDISKRAGLVSMKGEAEVSKKKNNTSNKVDDSDDDGVPLAVILENTRKRIKLEDKSSQDEKVTSDDDSDDDIPLAKLLETKKKSLEESRTKTESIKRKSITRCESPIRTESVVRSTQRGNSHSADFYDNTRKGFLVQQVMIRWWYVIDWPLPNDIGEAPPGYEPLEGFLGVFVSTRTENLGQLLDLRRKETCPSLINLIQKPSSELKDYCIRAIELQMNALRQSEGDDARLLQTLKSTLSEVKKVNPEKADNEAKKLQTSILNRRRHR